MNSFLRSLKETSSEPLSSPFSYMAQYLGRLHQHQKRRLTEPTLECFVLLSIYHGNLIQQMKNFTKSCPKSPNLFANKEYALSVTVSAVKNNLLGMFFSGSQNMGNNQPVAQRRVTSTN